jgi:hypothetical protein
VEVTTGRVPTVGHLVLGLGDELPEPFELVVGCSFAHQPGGVHLVRRAQVVQLEDLALLEGADECTAVADDGQQPLAGKALDRLAQRPTADPEG